MEIKLGVVLGQTASYRTSAEAARSCIAGYVTANDLSERSFQLEVSGGQSSKGECCAGFTPVWPWFVTAGEPTPAPFACAPG